MPIHPTAVIDADAEVDSSAEVGPHVIIEAGVRVGPRCKLHGGAFLAAGAALGAEVQVYPYAVVGHHPQDLAWKNTPSYVTIGDGTVIREHATIHRGTPPESTTRVGKRCFFMAGSHVAHNCTVGDEVKLANFASLAGWVSVDDGTFVSAHVGIHQFVRIGRGCMLSGLTRISTDVPHFMAVAPAGVIGLNIVGLRRAGMPAADRLLLRKAYRLLYRSGLPLQEAVGQVESLGDSAALRAVVDFLRSPSKRGFLRFRGRAAGAEEAGE